MDHPLLTGVVPVAHGEHTHAMIAGSKLVTYPTGGHLMAGRLEGFLSTARQAAGLRPRLIRRSS